MSRQSILHAALGCLAGLVLATTSVALAHESHEEGLEADSAVLGVPKSVQEIEWDNPCTQLAEDLANGSDSEELSGRYGVAADATVPGLGKITGYTCLAGSDTGLEAIVVHRRVAGAVYSDYLVAAGGRTFDWPEWFAATQPNVEMREVEHGWSTEPAGLSNGIPTQPAWSGLADVVVDLIEP